jgi:hypothetical protein
MPLALARRSRADGTGSLPPIRETDLDRILKLIPTEQLVLFVAAAPIAHDVSWRYFTLALFLIGAVAAPIVLFLDGRSTSQPATWPQYLVRTLTFAAWASAIHWPLEPWIQEHELRWVRSLSVLAVPLCGLVLLRDRSLDDGPP